MYLNISPITIIFSITMSLVIFPSCTLIDLKEDKKLDSLTLKSELNVEKCINEDIKIIASPHVYDNFKQEVNRLQKIEGMTLQSYDIFLLWYLHKMALSPHRLSPSSQLSALIYKNGEVYTMETSGNDNPIGLFMAYFMKWTGLTKKRVKKIIKLYDQHFYGDLIVSKDMSDFLQKNRTLLLQDNMFQKFYIRGNEVLREGEKLIKPKFTRIINLNVNILNKSNIRKLDFLKMSEAKISCSFDFQKDLNPRSTKQEAEVINFSSSDFSILLSIKKNKNINGTYKNTHFFYDHISHNVSEFCHLSLNQNKTHITLVATDTRAPNQILSDFIHQILSQKDMNNSHDIIKLSKTLVSQLKKSRKIHLQDPPRVIYEHFIDPQNAMVQEYGHKFPLYPAKEIGRIESQIFYQSKRQIFHDIRQVKETQCSFAPYNSL